MPLPAFVPVIGSGPNAFSDIGQQQLAWQGFNQQQDEANRRNALMRDEAMNNWFTRLAGFQQSEAARRDAADISAQEVARRAQADQINLALGREGSAEATRQFGIRQKLAERQQTWVETRDKQERDRQESIVSDYAQHLQPLINETGQKLEEAQSAHDDAVSRFMTRSAKAERQAGFPTTKVMLSRATNQYEARINPLTKQPEMLTPEEMAVVQKVNDDLGEINTEYLLAKQKLDLHTRDWQARQAEAAKWNLVPLKQGNTWMLRSPELRKTFGQMVAAAKKPAPPPPPEAPGRTVNEVFPLPTWQEKAIAGEAVAPGAGGFIPMDTTTATAPPAPGFQAMPGGGQVTAVWRLGPDGKVVRVQ